MKPYSLIAWILLQAFLLCSIGYAFVVPDFINLFPSGHFAGVSAPCTDLQTARNSAIADVIKQVLGAISAKYNNVYENKMSGDPRNPTRFIYDNFSRVASGVVLDVERNIVRSSYCQDSSGKYIFFILVKYEQVLVEKMRRLSKGSNIVASVLSREGGVLRIEITETNGVAVTLASADILITKKHRFAKFINFCIWKVPYGSTDSFSTALNPIKICGGSSIIKLDFRQSKKNWKDYLLSTKQNYRINIRGVDEIGRPVQTAIEY